VGGAWPWGGDLGPPEATGGSEGLADVGFIVERILHPRARWGAWVGGGPVGAGLLAGFVLSGEEAPLPLSYLVSEPYRRSR